MPQPLAVATARALQLLASVGEMGANVRRTTDVIAGSPFTLADAPTRTELLAKYFRGLGDPTRLRILRMLDDAGELSAGELVERLRMPQATVSTHLGCLRWCGFVTTRREDRSVIYSLADGRVSELVEIADSLLEDNSEHVACCQTIDSGDSR